MQAEGQRHACLKQACPPDEAPRRHTLVQAHPSPNHAPDTRVRDSPDPVCALARATVSAVNKL